MKFWDILLNNNEEQFKESLPGVSNDKGSKDGSNTGSWSSDSDGSSSSSDELGSRVNVPVGRGGLHSTDLKLTNVKQINDFQKSFEPQWCRLRSPLKRIKLPAPPRQIREYIIRPRIKLKKKIWFFLVSVILWTISWEEIENK